MVPRRAVVLGAPALGLLAACGSGVPDAARDPGAVALPPYAHPGAPSLTVITVYSDGVANDSGAHASLLINGSERALFDPAGSFEAEAIPRYGDVLPGMAPDYLAPYLRFQSSEGYYLVAQTLVVPLAVADAALAGARARGRVSRPRCAREVSSLLATLPGFAAIRPVWFPRDLDRAVAGLPGVARAELRTSDGEAGALALASATA